MPNTRADLERPKGRKRGRTMGRVKVECQCSDCDGAGLYSGMAERGGVAVVCHRCKGTGKAEITYTPFTRRKERLGVTRVIKCNPGICVTPELNIGGMSFEDWRAGKPFPPGSELREYTCPGWWYQIADYDLKPRWESCIGCGMFSKCEHFDDLSVCWERWDREYA